MWMNFGIKDLIDVLLVAFFLYQTYKLMKNSGTLAIFSGVVSFIIVWILVSQVLEMRLMGAILDKFISVGFLVLVILFQDEIRERREVYCPGCPGLHEYGEEKDGSTDMHPAGCRSDRL